MSIPVNSFEKSVKMLGMSFVDFAQPVDTGHWQALTNVPQTKTRELMGVGLEFNVPRSVEQLQVEVSPNLPWAENHFRERVGGEPLNPGKQYKNWPWYKGNVAQHQTVTEAMEKVKDTGLLAPALEQQFKEVQEPKFSHTYMERYWPKQAGEPFVDNVDMAAESKYNRGLRYAYGDLNDVVYLLAREPHTRQAYLPVWFPEDTGAVHGERVPCSLGYHFLLREDRLHCFYDIRSCDFIRHFRDDVYLTCRLLQWVLDELRFQEEEKLYREEVEKNRWSDVLPGRLHMQMHSLHVFEGDIPNLEKKYGSA